MNSISTHSPRFLEFLKFSVGSRMDSAYSILTLEPSLLSNQPFALFKEPALSAVEGVGDHEPVQPPGFLTAALAKRPSAMRRRPIRSTKGWRQFYNCSYEHTLLIRSSYDCGARASIRSPCSSACGTKCRSTRREERIDRADQLQRPECDPGDGEARGRKRHVVCLSQGRVFS